MFQNELFQLPLVLMLEMEASVASSQKSPMVSSSSAGVPRMLEDRHNNNTRLTSPDTLKANMSDIEQFQGKIVYNPDGSAYIIEDGDFSDEEELPVPMQEGSIIEAAGQLSDVDQFPTIENAIYVARNKSLNNYPAYVRAQTNLSERPTVHSYRVYNYRHKPSDSNSGPIPVETPENIPVKPILMCFICKLSFGNTKSFIAHCKDEHGLEFNEDEREMLKLEHVSALIQQVGKDKSPLLSFLEPVVKGAENHVMRSPSKSPSEGLGGHPSGIRVRNDLAASASSHPAQISPVSNGRSSTSPGVTSLSPSPSSFNTQSAGSYPGKGTTIGACPEHINGRPTGLDCAKCDLIMNTNRLGGLGWNASNNACKTLKCPKCNWHYKYQETLEIHMKEKHPDSDSNCIYCITGQQHPRLARGETYTCGYKPYRCEVCNYSTTTKGNLSIHMQSDKHINNMQELQNGGVVTASDGTKITQNILSKMPRVNQRLSSPHPAHQQNMWRCDICNFETSQPRNLRVHMTSDKHVQNITAIQQNMKQLQGIQLLQNLTNTDRNGGVLPALPPLQPAGEMMMMMEMASQAQHNQNIFLQLLARNSPPDLGTEAGDQAGEGAQSQSDPNPIKLFNCCICREFSTDTLDGLSSHIAIDRSVEGEGEVQLLLGGTHICKLCSYKTNLKANFQLHCKTDKHLARLSLYNHIREGGPANEWKLSMLTGTNPTQLRCNACDYNTNSLHKLQSHIQTQSHELSVILFSHLCQAELHAPHGLGSLSYSCTLCKFTSRGKAALLSHAKSLLHLRAEQLCEARRVEAGGEQPGIADIFVVTEYSDTEQAESSETGQ